MPTMLNLMKLMKESWLHTFLKDDSFPKPPPIRLLPTRAITPLHIELLVIGGEMSFFRTSLPLAVRRRGGKLGYGRYVSPTTSEQSSFDITSK